jgi:hypothetical protein
MPQSSQARVHEVDTESVDIPDTHLRVSRVALGTWAMGPAPCCSVVRISRPRSGA